MFHHKLDPVGFMMGKATRKKFITEYFGFPGHAVAQLFEALSYKRI